MGTAVAYLVLSKNYPERQAEALPPSAVCVTGLVIHASCCRRSCVPVALVLVATCSHDRPYTYPSPAPDFAAVVWIDRSCARRPSLARPAQFIHHALNRLVMFGDSVSGSFPLRYLFPEPEMLPETPLWVSEERACKFVVLAACVGGIGLPAVQGRPSKRVSLVCGR